MGFSFPLTLHIHEMVFSIVMNTRNFISIRIILVFSGTHQTLKRLEVAIEANQKSFVAHPSVQQLLSGIYYDGLPGFRRLHVFRQLLVVLKHACMFPIFSMAYMVAPNCKMGQLCKKPFLKFIFESASYMFFLFLLALASQKIEHVVFDVISKYIHTYTSYTAT